MVIKDGTGSNFGAKVDSLNRLSVKSFSEPLQHSVSHDLERAFQVRGSATPINGEVTVLYVFNDYEDRDLAVTYIRLQAVAPSGGTALPNALNYFKQSTGREKSSGGSQQTPVNMHFGSSVTAASVMCYSAGPVMGGQQKEFDRWYPSASEQAAYRKEGSVIIGPKQGLEISYVGDHTSGLLEARVSFLLLTENE